MQPHLASCVLQLEIDSDSGYDIMGLKDTFFFEKPAILNYIIKQPFYFVILNYIIKQLFYFIKKHDFLFK